MSLIRESWRIVKYLLITIYASLFLFYRLRQVDVKAEHFEKQVHRVEQERDQWEKKFEEAQEKYYASKKELDEVVQQMESL